MRHILVEKEKERKKKKQNESPRDKNLKTSSDLEEYLAHDPNSIIVYHGSFVPCLWGLISHVVRITTGVPGGANEVMEIDIGIDNIDIDRYR